MAQFYDLMNRSSSQSRMHRLLDAVAPTPTVGVLELAAGTGAMTQVLAHRCPELDIWAVEPSPAMRTALFTTVASDDQMRARVCVLPIPAQQVELDGVADLGLCLSALHVFSPRARRDAWRRVARALVPGGILLVDRPSERSPTFEECELLSTSIAGGSVVLTYATEPEGTHRQRWMFRYRQLDHEGTVLQQSINRTVSWRVSRRQLRGELARAGLLVEDELVLDENHAVYVVRRA